MVFEGSWGRHSILRRAAFNWRTAIAVAVCVVLSLAYADAAVAKPAFSAIAIDARTGKVLFSRDPDGIRHPASLTKVMTLYLLFEDLKAEKVKLTTRFKVSKAAASRAPSKLGLRPGQTVGVEDAIKALVTKSANDVASVIAENLSLTEIAFAARMTRKAQELGMSRTLFRNASGLPDPRQVTTARDMATLSLRIQRDFPQYYPYFRTMSFKYGGRTIKTHNRLLGRFAGTDGIKTGYIRASGFNLTSSVKRGGKRIIGVVMGAKSGGSRNAYMMSMLDKALPNCKDGTTLVSAIDGVKPKPAKAVKPAPEPEKKVAEGPKEAEQSEPIPPVQSDASEQAVPLGDGGGEALATAMADAARSDEEAAEGAAEPTESDEEPTEPDSGAQTVLTKNNNDAIPLPFAVKPKSDELAGVILVPPVDPSWHIQIGAYPSKKDAQAVLYKIRALDLDLLDNKQAFTIEVQKGGDTLYRARFSGFSEDNAFAACKRLTTKGFDCVAMQPHS